MNSIALEADIYFWQMENFGATQRQERTLRNGDKSALSATSSNMSSYFRM